MGIRTAAFLLGVLVQVGCHSNTVTSNASELDSDPDRIYRLSVSGDLVLALTRDGLYRGSLRTKRWERTSFPGQLGGTLVFEDQLQSNRPMFAILPKLGWPTKELEPTPVRDPGLYISRDNAKSWSLQCRDEEFRQILQVGKKLFAVVRRDPSGQRSDHGVVLVSEDQGSTWKDLTTPETRASSIFPDPDHPGLICREIVDDRSGVWQADDETYKWRVTMTVARRRPERTRPLFNSMGPFPARYATLNNYFEEDFGSESQIPGLTLVTKESKYAFPVSGAKPIEVEIRCSAQDVKIDLIDNKSRSDFWAIGVGNERFPKRLEPSIDRYDVAKKYRATNKLDSISLQEGSVYSRKLDLNELGLPQKPGVYRYRIFYGSDWSAAKRPSITERQGEFYGKLASEEFEVSLTP